MVVRGRLWRRADPQLTEERRQALVSELMTARRAVRAALGSGSERTVDGQPTHGPELAQARARVNEAKIALGERGSVWWQDCAPDYNRHMARNTPYAQWYAGLSLQTDDR